jgi:hypothetical protein
LFPTIFQYNPISFRTVKSHLPCTLPMIMMIFTLNYDEGCFINYSPYGPAKKVSTKWNRIESGYMTRNG